MIRKGNDHPIRGAPHLKKIRIGHLSTFYHTAILLMEQGNADARLGAEIEWKLMGTGPAIMKAFQQNELDLAYIGLPPAIIGMSHGINVVCVAGGHMEGTVLAGRPRAAGFPKITDLGLILRQFKGLAIGVPGTGSIHDVIVRDSLEQHGLQQQIEVINYPWADLVTEAMVRHEVAAAVGTPALAVAINRFAGGKILYPPSRLWPNNPSYGIVVDRGFLHKERETVERFLMLHEEATAFIRQEPLKAARLIADFVSVVDEQFVFDTLAVSPKYCSALTNDYVASTLKFVPVLRKLGYIQQDIDVDRIFSRELINSVHPGKDHYNDGIAGSQR
jgi:NitT/TauT family transport system substrate-binding protein